MSDKAKRVCIVSATLPPKFSGAGLRAYRYAERLHKKKKLAFILTYKQPKVLYYVSSELKSKHHGNIPLEKIVMIPWEYYRDKYHSLIKRFCTFLVAHIKLLLHLTFALIHFRHSFEIIHSFGASSYLSSYAIGISKILGKKAIIEMVLLDGDDPVAIMRNDPLRIKGKVRCWLFSRADIIISPSPALSSAYKSFGMPVEKLRELPHPVDTKLFSPLREEEKSAFREKLGIQNKHPIILFVGIILKRKKVDLLVQIFPRILEEYPNSLLLLIGPTSKNEENRRFTSEVKALVEQLGIMDKVIFTGQVNNVEDYMKTSDLFVFPSCQEGFPNVIVEAMATGLPVIALNIPGIIDYILQNGESGIIIRNKDPDGFALTICKLLKDKSLYMYISRNARKSAIANFSTKVIDREYRKIYEN